MQEMQYIVVSYRCPLCARTNYVDLVYVKSVNTESSPICCNANCYRQHRVKYTISVDKNNKPKLSVQEFLTGKRESHKCRIKNLGWRTEENNSSKLNKKLTYRQAY